MKRHAYRPASAGWVTVRAAIVELVLLIAAAVIFIAICAVSPR